ncbi:hypothetical protein GCM10023259_103700 [Thermocatellispora tengchongensis]
MSFLLKILRSIPVMLLALALLCFAGSYFSNRHSQNPAVMLRASATRLQEVLMEAELTGEREKGTADVASMKPEVTALVRNELKAEQIISKLKAAKGSTLEQLAQAYGSSAQVKTADNVVLGQGQIPGLGAEPVAVGKAFGLKPGQKSKAISS